MNIENISNHNANHVNDMEHITYGKPSLTDSRMKTEKMGFSLDITGKVRENAAYGKEELKSAEEIAQMAGMSNASVQRDYMAVMSNSMSDEDFAELIKDGVDPTKIPAQETVTNLDKIKIRMAESGQVIAGFNDDLTEEDIKAVLGNSFNAGKIISDTLKASDLPDTKENVSSVKEAVMMAQNLKPLTDEAISYMIGADMEPTIDNLYKAEYSAASAAKPDAGVHFDGAATYAGSDLTMSNWDDLKDQALAVIREAGVENEEEALSDARWIAAHELPITKESLAAYARVKETTLPADPKDLIAAMTVAMEEGKSAKEADLSKTTSLYTQASELVKQFMSMDEPADITHRRQLEEVRLIMTKEANLTLLRKGINIETEPLEQLVEKLKEAEREFYAPVLAENGTVDNDSKEEVAQLDNRIDLYKQTRSVLEEIPHIPVRTVADRALSDDFSLGTIAADARSLRAAYEKAGESYETLMTAPRADMGDSIQKAFRNVDDILEGLDMDVNDANRKAVRTLGYAGMMINKESVDNIRSATRSVETVVSLMTPARTLSMIREGHNPLTENIFDLERSLSQESFEETGEKYSRFLLRLEKNGEITQDEKRAFIGMYRLFNTIEKRDGKVIGNVLSSGKDLTLANMLEASRSNRHMNNEYVIDNDFGTLEKIVEKGDSITSQIERVFTQLTSPAPDKEYIEEKQREIRTAASGRYREAEDILGLISEPVTVENVIAVGAMTSQMGKGYKKLFSGQGSADGDRDLSDGKVLTEEDVKELTDGLTDSKSAATVYERFLDKAADITGSKTLEAETYEDVRTFSMLYKQIGFASSLARNESYEIPVKFEDGWSSIHLTIEHTKDDTGRVKATFDSEQYGRVDATFSVKTAGVDGFIVSNSRAGVENLKNIDDKIKEGLSKENLDTANLTYVFSNNINTDVYISGTDSTKVTNQSLYKIAKAFIGAVSTVSEA